VIARVVIMPKRGVLDPQGKAVCSSLHAMGYDEVDDVRIGRFLELKLGGGKSSQEKVDRVKAMCDRLLANGVIEDYRFELVEESAAGDGRTGPTR